MRFVGYLALIAASALSASAMAPAKEVAPSVTERTAEYKLGAGDKIHITVYNEDRFTGDFTVRGDGAISFPLIGDVASAGMTMPEFTKVLTARLADGYILDPRVSAEVTNFRPVFILGEVMKPGQYPFADGMTIYSLVAQAGGYTYRASQKSAKIRHAADAKEQDYRVSNSTAVEPGDTIRIGQRYI